MGKKRTRKNKTNAKHQFALSWAPEAKQKASVKRQSASIKLDSKTSEAKSKNAEFTDKQLASATVNRNIIKSLIIVSFVLALEVVVYLIWL